MKHLSHGEETRLLWAAMIGAAGLIVLVVAVWAGLVLECLG